MSKLIRCPNGDHCRNGTYIKELEKTIATLREELDNDDEMVKDYALQVIRLQVVVEYKRAR